MCSFGVSTPEEDKEEEEGEEEEVIRTGFRGPVVSVQRDSLGRFRRVRSTESFVHRDVSGCGWLNFEIKSTPEPVRRVSRVYWGSGGCAPLVGMSTWSPRPRSEKLTFSVPYVGCPKPTEARSF